MYYQKLENCEKLEWDDVEFQSDGKNSYSFKMKLKDEKKENALIRVFQIKEEAQKLFRCAYNQAISGAGKEEGKILRLHSSALLPLLCFYQANKKTLTIKVEDKEYKFNKCFFEVKNNVHYKEYKENAASNVDVVLCGEDKDGKKVMLFLESKFTENIMKNIVLEKKYEKWLKDNNKLTEPIRTFPKKAKTSAGTYYCSEGIKQMIAHLIGIKTGPRDEQSDYAKAYKNAESYILGCIMLRADNPLFDTKEKERMRTYQGCNNSKGYFKECMEAIGTSHQIEKYKDHPVEKDITIIPKILTYDDIFREDGPNSELLDERVKQFYRLDEDEKYEKFHDMPKSK